MHGPRISSRLAVATLLAALIGGAAAIAEEKHGETVVQIGQTAAKGVGVELDHAVPPCAADPDKLGISRVVEIDAAGGPEFGGQNAERNDFLNDHEVVLTFDDGPMRSHTRHVLDALAAQCTRATFFMIGRMAAADPAMVKEVIAAGHTAATHTWSHKNLRSVGAGRAAQEFEMGVSAVARASDGVAAPFFRFPYLSESRAIRDRAAKRNIATFWIDVDAKDYLTRNSIIVQRRVMAQLNAKGKGVILMHDIQPSTVGAIVPLLDELRLRGYKVVHVVPKARITTLPEYDAAIAKAFSDKAKAAADNPLADRSVVWTASPPEAAVEAGAKGRGPSLRRSPKQTTAAPAQDMLPWLEPPSATPKAKRPSGGDTWDMFSY